MRVRTLVICAVLVVAFGCGEEEGNNATDTNNDTTNNDGTNNGGTNNSIPPQDDWDATVTGGPEEMSAMGPKLSITIEGSTWAFVSNAVDEAQLAFNINGGEGLMEVPYRVSLFQLEIPDTGYECEALADLRVTVESADPPTGTFAGGVSCSTPEGEMFEGTTEGSWEAIAPE